MKKYIIISFICLCVLIVYSLIPSITPLFWQSGARQMYDFSYKNDLTVTLPFGSVMTSRQKISGILNMRVNDVGRDRIQLGFQMSPVSVVVDGKNVTNLEKILSSFFLAEIKPDGEFIRFIFNSGISKEEEKIIKSIIRSYQSIIVPGKFNSWGKIEEDGIGEYKSVYRAKKGYIVKQKQIYNRINNTGLYQLKNSKMNAAIGENSKIIINYVKSSNWIYSIRGVDNIEFIMNKKQMAASHIETTLKLADYNPDINLNIWKEENLFSTLEAVWGSGRQKGGSVLNDDEALSLKKKFEGKTFNGILKKFTVTGNMVPWESISLLKDYLTVNPAQCVLVSKYLLGGSLNNVQQAALIHVLELTGHSDAQNTLLNIVNSRSHTDMNRVRSIIALSGISRLSDDSVAGLQNLWESGEKGVDRELSDTAILALGNISSLQNEDAGDEDAVRRKKNINDFIEKKLSEASDTSSIATILTAIQNTGDSAFIDQVMPRMNDGDLRIRISAVNAAIAIGDDNTCKTVAALLGVEKEGRVKTAILDSLYDRPGMNSAVDFIISGINDESDPNLRKSMIRYLVKNRNSYPEIKNILEMSLQSETDSENRRLIYQGIYSKQD